MRLTTLGLDQVAAGPKKSGKATTDCPACGAPEKKRVDAGGFGRQTLTCCGVCGYEFPQE